MAQTAPKAGERVLCAIASAYCKAVGHHRSINGTCAAGADPINRDARVVKQPVENAPGESTMGAATLQGQIDGLLLHRRCRSGAVYHIVPQAWRRLRCVHDNTLLSHHLCERGCRSENQTCRAGRSQAFATVRMPSGARRPSITSSWLGEPGSSRPAPAINLSETTSAHP